MDKLTNKMLYFSFLGALLITVNIYFGLFIWNTNNLSPNVALLIVTIFPIYMSFREVSKLSKQRKEVKSE